MDKIYVKQATDLLSTHSYFENLDVFLSPFGFAFRKVKIRHAIQLYEKAINACFELSKQSSDSVGEYYMEIGYLYGVIGEPLNSADNYLKSAENYSDTNRAFISISFAMDIYFSLKKDHLTPTIYVKIVEFYKILSELHYKVGEYAECAKYLNKCIHELNRYDFSNKRIEFYEKLAFVYLIHLDRQAIALTICEEIVRIDKTENRNKYLKICEYLRKDDLASSRKLIL